MSTLPLSDVVSISVVLSPTAAIGSSFDLGLIVGTSAVIAGTAQDRVRLYSSLTAMIADGFVSTDAEYLAAQLYFAQVPQPGEVAIGRWNNATETALAAVQACRAANTNWYLCTVSGAADVDVLEIAAYIEAASPNSAYFNTTADAAVLSATALVSGYETSGVTPSTNISAGAATTLQIAVDGDVYGLAPTYHSVTLTVAGLNTGALIAAALQTAIQAIGSAYAAVTVTYTTVYTITSGTKGPLSKVRITDGATNDVASVLKLGTANGAVDTDGTGSLGLALQAASYMRTLTQYSTTADAVAAIEGYAMGANTGGANSAFTLDFKQEIGVTPDSLTETEVTALQGQNVNYYINRGNTYNLFETGVMADGTWFDELLGLDQLTSGIASAVMNLLKGTSKVPQDEGGMTLLHNAIDGPCSAAKDSGFLAPGQWNAPSVLTLQTGDTLPLGYVIMSESVASQSQADRSARKSPPIYICLKLAGAIQFVSIVVMVNQ